MALASRAAEEKKIGRTIMTEVLPAMQWYDAEKYHQQYLAKGGRGGNAQSAAKGCKDPIRCGAVPDRSTLFPRSSKLMHRAGATGKPQRGSLDEEEKTEENGRNFYHICAALAALSTASFMSPGRARAIWKTWL